MTENNEITFSYESKFGPPPEEWNVELVEKVVNLTGGKTPNQKKEISSVKDSDNIPWFRSGELNNGELFRAEKTFTRKQLTDEKIIIYPPGTLLIGIYTSTIGKLAILKTEASINQAICAIHIKEGYEKIIEKEFIYYYFLSIREELKSKARGSAQQSISKGMLYKVEIPVPSHKTQIKIIKYLRESFFQIENTMSLFENSESIAANLMNSFLSQAIENLGIEITTDRIKVKLTGKKANSESQSSSKLAPFYQNETDFHRLRTSTQVPIAIISSRGSCTVLDEEQSQNLKAGGFIIESNSHNYSPYFLMYIFNSSIIQNKIKELRSQYSGLRKKDLENIEVPIPTLEVQISFCEYMDQRFTKAIAISRVCENNLTRLKDLKESFLMNAFSNKFR